MRDEYDFKKAHKRPEVARKLGAKQSVTIRLDVEIVEYFRKLSDESGQPYQRLINSYLADCVAKGRRPTVDWT